MITPDPFATRTADYLAHHQTIRGVVRHTLVARQLEPFLPNLPAHIADIGGGDGKQSVPLAERGYDVTLLDPSQAMIEQAEARIGAAAPGTKSRLRLLQGYGEDAPAQIGDLSIDVVLCHGVLMYLDSPEPLVAALACVLRPGGIISILTKNGDALAMRSAFEGRYRDALTALNADRDRGGMGITRAHKLEYLLTMLETNSLTLEAWYGIRIFTDHLGNAPPGPDIDDILELEWQAGSRDPYRRVARLIHVIARRHR